MYIVKGGKIFKQSHIGHPLVSLDIKGKGVYTHKHGKKSVVSEHDSKSKTLMALNSILDVFNKH